MYGIKLLLISDSVLSNLIYNTWFSEDVNHGITDFINFI